MKPVTDEMRKRARANEGRQEKYLEELRDTFAAHALCGSMTKEWCFMETEMLEAIARTCYEMADAMLKVREES